MTTAIDEISALCADIQAKLSALSEPDVQRLEVGQVLIDRLRHPMVVLMVDGADVLVAAGESPIGFMHSYVQRCRGAIIDRACTPWASHNGIVTRWLQGRGLSFPHEFNSAGDIGQTLIGILPIK